MTRGNKIPDRTIEISDINKGGKGMAKVKKLNEAKQKRIERGKRRERERKKAGKE